MNKRQRKKIIKSRAIEAGIPADCAGLFASIVSHKRISGRSIDDAISTFMQAATTALVHAAKIIADVCVITPAIPGEYMSGNEEPMRSKEFLHEFASSGLSAQDFLSNSTPRMPLSNKQTL